jgi:hypothetical protein
MFCAHKTTNRPNRLALLLCGAALCGALACSDDTTTADSGVDAGVDVGGSDLTSPDLAPDDLERADLGSDGSATSDEQGVADAAGDLGPAVGCATQGTMVGADIAACTDPAGAVNQCAAASYCASGWALCSASQYQTRFGSASAPPSPVTQGLWLAGCVRDGALPSAPVDGVCSSCAADLGADKVVGWSCLNSVTTSTESLRVGLRTASACTHAGTNAPTTKGFWAAWPAKSTLSGALCCRK